MSEEDGQGRNKEDFAVIERSSLSKYCGLGVEQLCLFPASAGTPGRVACQPCQASPGQAWWGRSRAAHSLRSSASGVHSGNPEKTNSLLPDCPPLCTSPVFCLRTTAQPLRGRRGSP